MVIEVLMLVTGGVNTRDWLIVSGSSGVVVTALFIVKLVRRWKLTNNHRVESVGNSAVGAEMSWGAQMVSGSSERWIGAGTLPGLIGYIYATSPLVVLEVAGEMLCVRLRPKLVAKIFGMEPLVADVNDVSIFLLKSDAVWQGLEIRVPEVHSYYFWINRIADMRAEIIACLSHSGFQISDRGGRESWEWPVK